MSEPPPPAADDSSRLRVAIDAGPLYGHRTGVGVATAGLLEALAARADVELDPYVVSFRSKPDPGHRRLPMPGIVASRVWAHSQWPRFDRGDPATQSWAHSFRAKAHNPSKSLHVYATPAARS